MFDLSWDEEICLKPYSAEMELPEDLLFYFGKINPLIYDLIEKYDLELVY